MTCGTPASTEPMAATCRSSATRPAFRSRSCDVQPGSTHDLTAARATGFLGAVHGAAGRLGLPSLADKGYDGAGAGIHTPVKGGGLHPDTTARNELIGGLRARGARAIAVLKTRWKALRGIRMCPQRIGAVVAAALVLTTLERPIRRENLTVRETK